MLTEPCHDPAAGLNFASRLATARKPTSKETPPAGDLAAWATVAMVILDLPESAP